MLIYHANCQVNIPLHLKPNLYYSKWKCGLKMELGGWFHIIDLKVLGGCEKESCTSTYSSPSYIVCIHTFNKI